MGFVWNYLRNLPAVALGRQPHHPLLFSYYLTHRCTLNCSYCSDGDGRRFKEDPLPELSTDDAKRLVSVLARSGDTLDLTGGEPLLREDLGEILAHARSAGLRTVLNTKGIGLPERADLLEHVDVLVLSLDTLEASKLARLMGRGLSEADAVLATLQFAVRRREAVRVVLSCVATPANVADVGEVLLFARRHGLAFHLSPEIQGQRPHPDLRGNRGYLRLLQQVEQAKRDGASVLGIAQYLRGIREFSAFVCHPLLMPVIRPDGRLYYPCLESKQAEISVLEAGSYEAALAQARRRYGPPPACQDCCHLFCHMALSLLQRHPLAALREQLVWRAARAAPVQSVAYV